MRLKRQTLAEQIHITPFRLRTKPRIKHIVRACHTLNDIAAEVRVDPVGGDVDAFARLQHQIVHRDQRDQYAGVGLGILLRESRSEFWGCRRRFQGLRTGKAEA